MSALHRPSLSLLLWPLVIGACSGAVPTRTRQATRAFDEVATAPPELRSLRYAVGVGDIKPDHAKPSATLAELVRGNLARAGLLVVDERQPHEVTFSLAYASRGAGFRGTTLVINGDVSLAASAGGGYRELFPFQKSFNSDEDEAFYAEAAGALTRRALGSGLLVSWARTRSGSEAPVVAAAPSSWGAPPMPPPGPPANQPGATLTRTGTGGAGVASAPAVLPPPASLPAPSPPPAASKAFVVAAPQPTTWALVVGVDRYRDLPAASGARADAERVAELLRTSLGLRADHLKVALDERASKVDLEKHLEWLAASVPAGGRALVYFAGHGAPSASDGSTWLVPWDGDPAYLETTSVRLTTLLGGLQKTKARDALVLVDACFSGGGGRSVMAKGTRPLVALKPAQAPSRVALFSASGPSETSGAGSTGGGLFTQYLVEALGRGQADVNGDGQIALGELQDWVGPRVTRDAARANRVQTPSLTLGVAAGQPNDFIVSYGYAAP